MSACLPPGPGPQYVGPVLRRYRPTITIVVGFLLGLVLAMLDKMFPPGHSQGPIAVIAVIVDWTAPPLAGALVAAALLVAQRYKRLHDAERAASKVLAERLTGTERRQALWVVAAAIAHDLKNPLHNLQLLMEELDEESDPGKRGELIARLRENVVANALEALQQNGSGGRLAVRARHLDGVVELTVEDNGPGIADEVRPRLFIPFASGRESTGLGLAIARALARACCCSSRTRPTRAPSWRAACKRSAGTAWRTRASRPRSATRSCATWRRWSRTWCWARGA